MMRVTKQFTLLLILLTVCSSVLRANEETTSKGPEAPEKFNTGKLIFDHIKDGYVWHIAKVGHTHISIPLPVILYSTQSGLHVFMSSKFHHGTTNYDGFEIAKEGKYEGKVVEVLSDGSELKPWDLSITKNVTSLLISIAFILSVFLTVAKRYSDNYARAPKGIQSFLEPIILFIRDDIARPSLGNKHYEKFLPFLLTIFFFIFINNLLGLVPFFPGGANLTGNISVTLVLALFTFTITTINGTKDYWMHIINAPGIPWWLKLPFPLMPIVEILGVFTKPFVLTIRLFANITAGHIVALAFYCLIFIFAEFSSVASVGVSIISVSFTIFMSILEMLVAFIQAYVFTLLSAIYFSMALEKHEKHAESH
jgi:F-type H+-transporting ATPase subunit a